MELYYLTGTFILGAVTGIVIFRYGISVGSRMKYCEANNIEFSEEGPEIQENTL